MLQEETEDAPEEVEEKPKITVSARPVSDCLRACVGIELNELCMHNMLIGSNVDHFTGG